MSVSMAGPGGCLPRVMEARERFPAISLREAGGKWRCSLPHPGMAEPLSACPRVVRALDASARPVEKCPSGQRRRSLFGLSRRSFPQREKAPLHQTVTPDGQWRPYVLTFTVTEYSSEMLGAGFELTNGTLLLDEVSLIREGDGNPTAFRDEVVDALKQLHPGCCDICR